MTISLAAEIYKRAHVEGRFRLRSGASSTEYFDKYRFESDPLLLRQISEQLCELLPTGAEALAGLEVGGIPIATCASTKAAHNSRGAPVSLVVNSGFVA